MQRRAKIVATIGPSSADRDTLRSLLDAGVDVCRLNLSHGSRDDHRSLFERIREVSEEDGRFVAVLMDLMGPRYRLGEVREGRSLEVDEVVSLGIGDGVDLQVTDRQIVEALEPGHRILIDNGLVEARVVSRRAGKVRAKITFGGPVSTRKGLNLPDSDLPFEISRKDREDIKLAVELGADYLAASYVGEARDVNAIRRVVRQAGGTVPIVAKIERRRAIDHLEEIIESADAVMVARGDLGVEVETSEVPILQKRMIDVSWRLGRPVIVATQMLESMMEHPRPTRAEASDVANAVFDGADAVMLSGETAAGNYPVEVVHQAIHRGPGGVGSTTSASAAHRLSEGLFDLEPPARPGMLEIPETITWAAVVSARRLGAKFIVVLTKGGYTARMLACRRPSTPVIALTQSARAGRALQLVWGLRPLHMQGDVYHHDEVVGLVDRHLLAAGLVEPGDEIAILMGDPIQGRPPTNLLRLHRVVDSRADSGNAGEAPQGKAS